MKNGGILVLIFISLAFSMVLLVMAISADQSPMDMWKSIRWPQPYVIKRFALKNWWLLLFFGTSLVAFVFALSKWLRADENAAEPAKETNFQKRLIEYKSYYDRYIVRQFSNKK